ncbi:MAG: NAD-dependent malic enzyme [Desulfobulbaceae bacterium]|nr:NAD-dependent malic enzyme [Desulfobulbaceae bacterium]
MLQQNYGFSYDEYGNTKAILVYQRGFGVFGNSYTCKGNAYTQEERNTLEVDGSAPPTVRTLEQQVANSTQKVNAKESDIEKFIYLRALFDRNVTLAHAVIAADVARYMRIIYTPTVGLACQNYSSMFRQANGLHFYPGNIDKAESILRQFTHRDIRVAVVTDNQGILGIGDQGAGGIAICLGKLMLYTQGAGIAPWHCLPISLDVGTDNHTLLDDPEYLGWRHERLKGQDYIDFIQRFARAFRVVFPNAICQWEDFSKQNAFAIRDSYLHDLISFNDDIQGTGAITLAGVYSAMKIKNESITDQVFLIHGAGAGGVGIAEQIDVALIEAGLDPEQAKARIFTLDSHGLVTTDRRIEPYKEKFAKDPAQLPWLQKSGNATLLNTIKEAKVTVLIGTSGQHGCFSKEIVMAMLANSKRPVILPLSNPTSMSEAEPKDIYEWSNGQALVATGSPFEPVTHDGKAIRIGQCNNVFVFPGVGLGVLASGAKEVLPSFFTAAAKAVSQQVSEADLANGVLFPAIDKLNEVSLGVAFAVGEVAIQEGVSRLCVFSSFQHNNNVERLKELITKMRWSPTYLPLIPM